MWKQHGYISDLMLSEKVRHNSHVLCDSIHVKFKTRQNQPVVVEIRSLFLERGQRLRDSMKELSPGVEMFYILMWEVVAWMDTHVKIHQAVHLTLVHFIVYMVYIHRKQRRKPKQRLNYFILTWWILSKKRIILALKWFLIWIIPFGWLSLLHKPQSCQISIFLNSLALPWTSCGLG